MRLTTLPEGNRICGIRIRQPYDPYVPTGDETIENRPRAWFWRGWVRVRPCEKIDRAA